ncbi:MAG TPA: hypothetical protein VI278_03590 [Nitrososphaeraceae archaeon]
MPNKIVTYIKDLKFSDQVRLAEIKRQSRKENWRVVCILLNALQRLDMNTEKVLTEFKDIQYLDHKLQALEIAIDEMENDV